MKIYSDENGFTIIEVIAILIIVGILSVVAVSRISSNEYNIIAATDTLTSHLRLAQARAMNTSDTSSVVGVCFTSTTQYYLFYCAAAGANCNTVATNQSAFPGAGSIIMDITGTGVTVTNGNGVILAFNRFGTPFTNAALTTILAGNLVLNLQDGSGRTRTINITPQTGMITS